MRVTRPYLGKASSPKADPLSKGRRGSELRMAQCAPQNTAYHTLCRVQNWEGLLRTNGHLVGIGDGASGNHIYGLAHAPLSPGNPAVSV